jgi:hypothetical protein
LLNKNPSPRKSVLYYRGTDLYAARLGDYKAHFITQGAYGQFGERTEHAIPLLFNLNHDAAEQFNIAEGNDSIIQQINTVVREHQTKLVRGEDQLAERE